MKSIIISILCLLALGCQPETKPNARPAWIQNFGDGAVGSCGTHLKGRHYQDELAISRAITRLAKRHGIEVSQIQQIQQSANKNTSYVTSKSVTDMVMKNNTVKAHVRKVWYDKPKDTVWAWVHPVK